MGWPRNCDDLRLVWFVTISTLIKFISTVFFWDYFWDVLVFGPKSRLCCEGLAPGQAASADCVRAAPLLPGGSSGRSETVPASPNSAPSWEDNVVLHLLNTDIQSVSNNLLICIWRSGPFAWNFECASITKCCSCLSVCVIFENLG